MLSGVAGKSVYFEFDKYAIKSDQLSAITDHSKLAASYTNDFVTLQGSCDERGSREYNLALGQKRADAVKSRLVLLGVTDGQLETISFGEERARAQGHDEASWAENRRADLVYK